jgi:protein-S-isoprenylcysteine O-methyltransferase Ste14
LPLTSPDWSPFLPGVALWALALYLPLSGPLGRLEEALAAGPLPGAAQQVVLVVSCLALAIGVLADLALSWALGPDWASSLGLIAAGWGLFTALASRAREDGE